MANIKSAKKRILTNKRQRGENKYVKSTIATLTKSFRALLSEGKLAEAQSKLTETISYIDSACAKGVLHKNNASRKVARLTSALDQAKKNAPAPEVKEVKVKKVEATPAEVTEVVEAPKAKKTTTKKATATKEVKAEPKKATTKTATKKTATKATAEEKPAKKTATKKTSK